MSDAVTVFVRPGDPASEATLRYLDQRGVAYTKRDVLSDPSATAILFGRLGKVVVPVVQVGERLLVGHDPVQLARFLPRPESEEQHVAFGASVRTVTAEIAIGEGAAARPTASRSARSSRARRRRRPGILPGDVITGIGPYTVNGGADQFRRAVSLRQPGDTMMLTHLARRRHPPRWRSPFPTEMPAEVAGRRSAGQDEPPV